ncbi:MurR/RpiR family transcriptional regulator [Lentibacillus daqui]|uniref:MurR/RpiR family transcriptional regulator n=1 Tax=Lentibacillus daqui TaxID=2911514 RepID=UPI0022B1D97B|nr:MurR/RpiR family transcriptional regulator [Lentibacillus daqui]
MNVSDFLVHIKSVYPSLTKREKKVAAYISENYNKIVFTSLNEFAKECGVGEATVFRFFKKLGFTGYHAFKVDMAEQLRHPERDDVQLETDHTYQNIIQMLDDTKRLTSVEKLKQVAQTIVNSQSIYLFGIGFSGLAAQGAQIRFMRLGYKTFVFSDPHAQLVSSHLMTADDMAIAFSITGDTIQTIDWLHTAKQSGATTLAITNHARSDITKIADMNIYTAGKEVAQEGSTLVTEMSQLYVIEQICHYLYEMDYERINKVKQKIAESID